MKEIQLPELNLEIPISKIRRFCIKNHIRKLALFGSILTKRFQKSSDVDILVEFDTKHMPGLIGISRMEYELTDIIGRKVDLRTPNDLSPFFRNEVLAEVYHIYGKERFCAA